jgi:hypothetical protein
MILLVVGKPAEIYEAYSLFQISNQTATHLSK